MFVEVGERNKGDFVKYKKFSTSASMDAYCIETKTTALLLFDAELLRSRFLASEQRVPAMSMYVLVLGGKWGFDRAKAALCICQQRVLVVLSIDKNAYEFGNSNSTSRPPTNLTLSSLVDMDTDIFWALFS